MSMQPKLANSIVEALTRPMSAEEIAEAIEHPKHATKRALVDLMACGRIRVARTRMVRGGRRNYYVTDEREWTETRPAAFDWLAAMQRAASASRTIGAQQGVVFETEQTA